MEIKMGESKSEFGPGVHIDLNGNELATAIDEYLTRKGVVINGARTTMANYEMCKNARVYVDPSAKVIHDGKVYDGRGVVYEEDWAKSKGLTFRAPTVADWIRAI